MVAKRNRCRERWCACRNVFKEVLAYRPPIRNRTILLKPRPRKYASSSLSSSIEKSITVCCVYYEPPYWKNKAYNSCSAVPNHNCPFSRADRDFPLLTAGLSILGTQVTIIFNYFSEGTAVRVFLAQLKIDFDRHEYLIRIIVAKKCLPSPA